MSQESARYKDRARASVTYAVKKGRLARPRLCSGCRGDGGGRPIEAHHHAMHDALVEAEAALAVKASLRDAEQARVERALESVRDALAAALPESREEKP